MKTKILLLSVLFLLVALPLVSAERLTYSNEDLKVTLSDTVLFGLIKTGDFGTAELKSHNSVQEIKKVGLGKQVVMYYDFNFNEIYPNGFGKVYFTDMKTGELVERDWRYVYWGNESYESPIYEDQLINSKNGTIKQQVKVGTETKTIEKWLPYNSRDIPKGQLRIGIEVEVKKNDWIDGVWEVGGKKIDKHSQWTSDLNVGLVAYYTFNDTTNFKDISGNGNDGTNNGGTNVSGILGSAYNFSGGDYVLLPNITSFSTEASWNAWGRLYDIGGNEHLWSLGNKSVANTQGDLYQRGSNSYFSSTFRDDRITKTVPTLLGAENWVMITITQTPGVDGWRLYFNGTNVANDTGENIVNLEPNGLNFQLGRFWQSGDNWLYFLGTMDEAGLWNRSLSQEEVTQLYNDGNAINPLSFQELSVSLLSPENNTNLTDNTPELIVSVADEFGIGIGNLTVNIFNSSGNVFSEINTSGFTGNYSFTTSTLQDGDYEWNATAVGDDSVQYDSSTFSFSIDTVATHINISAPFDGQTFDFLENNQNITLNVTATDTNLDICWYEYNSTNTTFPCSSGVLSENNLTINNESIITVWANDTFGQENSSTSDWSFNLFDFDDYTFDATITESSSTTFIGNFQTGTSLSSASLQYNNTNNSVSTNSLGGNRYTLTSIVTSPIVGSDTNITWFFWVNNVNATSQNQTVTNVQLDSCSSFTFPIVNYSLVDELTQTEINNSNSSIESLVILKTLGGNDVAQFNETFTGDSTPSVCSEDNLNSSGLRIWEQSRYGSDDYVFEQHNNQNKTMASLPLEIILRDLPSDDATTFRIVYKSDTFLPIPDAVIEIQRKYIGEGVFKEAESPITDANGETSASLDLNSVIYRILVKKNGITLGTFENPAIFCDNILTGDCVINLNEKDTTELINTYDEINDLDYGLTQNNRTITLTFEIPSGESKTINLFVNQSSILGNETSCNQTLLATSGQLQCTIDSTLGDVFANAYISSEGNLITVGSTQILEDRSQYFGTDNIVLTFFLVLSLVLIMISDPIAVLIGIVVGLLSATLMLFLNSGTPFGTIPVLTYIIIVVTLLIIKISQRQR